MGLIKRILRQTSSKLLTKLGASRNSHQLVLNQSLSPTTVKVLSQLRNQSNNSNPSNRTKTNSKRSRRREKNRNKDETIPEALLMAAKNHLPPVQFHHVHGPNALLGKNKFVARRTQSFCQALVFSNRVILPNERVYIKVLEIAKGWSGTIRFGFTSVDPATLRYQMPKHACPDMTSAGHTWARALADEVVRRNSVIHFSYNLNGYIHYGINNQDCGIFYANVNTSQHLWFIVDIYGLTAAVELIDPRIHNTSGSSDLDLSRSLEDVHDVDDIPLAPFSPLTDRNNAFKSTNDNNLYGASTISSRMKKKRARKEAARQAAILYEQWPPEGLLFSAPMTSRFNIQAENAARSMLPNLNSILPSAQQNIYSPMPNMINPRGPGLNDSHDYYQIMQTNGAQLTTTSDLYSMRIQPSDQAQASGSTSSALNVSSSSSTSASSSSTATSGCSRSADVELADQLLRLKINTRSDNKHKQLSAGPSSTNSKQLTKSNDNKTPVAAARKRQQSNSIQMTNFKRTSDSIYNQTKQIAHSGTNNSTKAKSGNNNCSATNVIKPKVRQSLKKSQATSRDINNNSPTQSKDCPICFERPINCVLYQCGHMCTCYECGVKQWRTQSRTCPICRTVIKDVIKTYMS